MTNVPHVPSTPFSLEVSNASLHHNDQLGTWLARPLSRTTSACLLLVVLVAVPLITWAVNGPTLGDANLSMYTTWLLAHGNVSCAYPTTLSSPHVYVDSVLTSPLYPIIAAIISAILHVGHSVLFPSAVTMAPHCAEPSSELVEWARRSGALEPTLWIGVITWIALVVAISTFLNGDRDFTRGRAVGLVAAGFGAPLYQALVIYFHPQDLLALALIVGALAAALHERWLLAGALLGLGLLAQPFVILALIPFLVACPRRHLSRLSLGSFLGSVPIAAGLLLMTSGAAWFPLILGSDRVVPDNDSDVTSTGGSVLWELHPRGVLAFLVARGLPVALSLAVSLFARHKWKGRFHPQGLVALVGVSLSLRLVFELNLFSYYFAAVFVLLVLTGATMASRVDLIALWTAFDLVGFNPIRRTTEFWFIRLTPSYDRIPAWTVVAILGGVIIMHLRERRVVMYQPVALVVIILMTHRTLWGHDPSLATVPHWFLQVLLVPFAIALFVDALRRTTGDVAPSLAWPRTRSS